MRLNELFNSSTFNLEFHYVDGTNVGTVPAYGTLSGTVNAGYAYSLRATQVSGYTVYASEYTATSQVAQPGYIYTWNIENGNNLQSEGIDISSNK